MANQTVGEQNSSTAIYSDQNLQVDQQLSDRISAFLGRKLELVAVEADNE